MKWLGLSFILILFLLGQPATTAQQNNQAFRFVDINEVLDSYEKAQKADTELQKDYRLQIADLERQKDELKKKKRELDPLDPNSNEYFQGNMALEIDLLKLQRHQEWLQASYEKKRYEALQKAYEEIQAGVAKYAAANQLSAVFIIEKAVDSDSEEGENLREKMIKMRVRKVLYFDPSLDVTTQIIKILNSQ